MTQVWECYINCGRTPRSVKPEDKEWLQTEAASTWTGQEKRRGWAKLRQTENAVFSSLCSVCRLTWKRISKILPVLQIITIHRQRYLAGLYRTGNSAEEMTWGSKVWMCVWWQIPSNPSTGEDKAGGSLWFQGHPDLHREFQASQCYTVRPCLKTNK